MVRLVDDEDDHYLGRVQHFAQQIVVGQRLLREELFGDPNRSTLYENQVKPHQQPEDPNAAPHTLGSWGAYHIKGDQRLDAPVDEPDSDQFVLAPRGDTITCAFHFGLSAKPPNKSPCKSKKNSRLETPLSRTGEQALDVLWFPLIQNLQAAKRGPSEKTISYFEWTVRRADPRSVQKFTNAQS